MHGPAQNKALLGIGVVTALMTICVQLIQVGSLKGRVETVINAHEQRIGNVEASVKTLHSTVSNIEGRLHGIASQVGKVPGRVASRLENEPVSKQP